MPAIQSPSKYRHLRGGVRSFTEGFTSLINSGFALLAVFAIDTQRAHYHCDQLTQRIEPPLPEDASCVAALFRHNPASDWLGRIEISPEHVTHFTTDITFDLSTVRWHDYERSVRFTVATKIVDDRGVTYEWHLNCTAFTIETVA